MDISQVLSILSESRAATQGMMDGADVAFNAQKGAISAEGSAQRTADKAGIAVEMQAEQGMLQSQKNMRKAAEALGMNMDTTNEIVTSIGNVMRNSAKRWINSQKEVEKYEANNDLLTSPIGFLNDLLFGGEARSKAAAAEGTFKAASTTLNALNVGAQQTGITQKAIAEIRTDASLLQRQKQLEAIAAQNAAKIQQRLAGVDIARINMLDSLNARQTSLAMSAYNVQVQEEARAAAAAERQERKQSMDEMIATYNVGAEALNKPKVNSAAEFNKAITLNKNQTGFILDRGFQIQTSGSMTLGSNPIAALQNADSFGIPLNEAQKNLAQKINNISAGALNINTLTERLIATTGASKAEARMQAMQMISDKKQHPQLQLDHVGNTVGAMMNLIQPGDSSNIYQPAPISTLVDAGYMKSNPFLAEYLLPRLAAASTPVEYNYGDLVSAGVDAVKSGKIATSDIVEGIQWIGQQSVIRNNTINNYPMLGLPAQEHLPVPIKISKGGLFSTGQTRVSDAIDPVRIAQDLQDMLTGPVTSRRDGEGNIYQSISDPSDIQGKSILDYLPTRQTDIPGQEGTSLKDRRTKLIPVE